MNQKLILENWRKFLKEELTTTQPSVSTGNVIGNSQKEEEAKIISVTAAINSSIGTALTSQIETIKTIPNKQAIKDAIKNLIDKIELQEAKKKKFKLNENFKNFIETEETEYDNATLEDGTLACPACLQELLESDRTILQEAKYQGKTVTLNKPMKGDVKKSKVYVKNGKGNVVKVNFGDKNMTIKKNIPARRKSFRARHKCDQKKDKTSAGYWSCKAW